MRLPRTQERCELCGLELATRRLACSCDACAVLFSGQQNGRFRRVPRRVQLLPDFN